MIYFYFYLINLMFKNNLTNWIHNKDYYIFVYIHNFPDCLLYILGSEIKFGFI